MSEAVLYEERLSSNKTEALFLALAGLLGGLAFWRARSGQRGGAGQRGGRMAAGLGVGALVFGFYALNYRTLVIRLTPSALTLTFGLFRWVVPLEAIEACALDELPPLQRLGGAGIHFMFVRGRYRASFNFLEYPRVVIALKRSAGPVRDVSFSTRRPEEVCRLIEAARAAG